jgi:hypothetical protein
MVNIGNVLKCCPCGKLMKHHRGLAGECKYISTIVDLGADEDNGQLYAPAALPQAESERNGSRACMNAVP